MRLKYVGISEDLKEVSTYGCGCCEDRELLDATNLASAIEEAKEWLVQLQRGNQCLA